ncbi:hypothetical protein DIPPA_23049 [Diplonema papillatum]|nr:hypothetical protein DIPPA_23049 [Diplonema papillatum]
MYRGNRTGSYGIPGLNVPQGVPLRLGLDAAGVKGASPLANLQLAQALGSTIGSSLPYRGEEVNSPARMLQSLINNSQNQVTNQGNTNKPAPRLPLPLSSHSSSNQHRRQTSGSNSLSAEQQEALANMSPQEVKHLRSLAGSLQVPDDTVYTKWQHSQKQLLLKEAMFKLSTLHATQRYVDERLESENSTPQDRYTPPVHVPKVPEVCKYYHMSSGCTRAFCVYEHDVPQRDHAYKVHRQQIYSNLQKEQRSREESEAPASDSPAKPPPKAAKAAPPSPAVSRHSDAADAPATPSSDPHDNALLNILLSSAPAPKEVRAQHNQLPTCLFPSSPAAPSVPAADANKPRGLPKDEARSLIEALSNGSFAARNLGPVHTATETHAVDVLASLEEALAPPVDDVADVSPQIEEEEDDGCFVVDFRPQQRNEEPRRDALEQMMDGAALDRQLEDFNRLRSGSLSPGGLKRRRSTSSDTGPMRKR